MSVKETIAAISTPPGRGGIGIVRLSGPHAVEIASAFTEVGEHARAKYTRVLGGLDEAVVTAFRGPHSYTGEDVVEIATHGSPVVLAAVLDAAMAAGARAAAPGEFTQRAFESGRMDLAQAEAVHDLIAARTLEAVRSAAQQMGGALSRRLAPAKERLLHLVALLEAGMDFASGELDDVDVVAPGYIAEEIAAIDTELRALVSTYRRGSLLRTGAALAIVGRPNAGKSSLFNRLLERERAIVTPVAGTTRDTVEETWSLDGIPVRLIDTAGLRAEDDAAADEAEAMGIARSREALADADVVLLVHDASLEVSAGEARLLQELAGRPHVVVMNKVDLSSSKPVGPLSSAVRTSAVTGEGLAELRAAVLAALDAGGAVESAALTNPRQLQAMEDALVALGAAAEANATGMPHEALAMDLHRALEALDSLTGQTTADDILTRIFSAFCIGK